MSRDSHPDCRAARKETKGPLAASFAAVRVRIADGPEQRIHDKGAQHMPGEEAWLVGERRASGERKYYLSNLPADATSRRSPPRSRRDGSASKPTSSSRKNLASTTRRPILAWPAPPRAHDDDRLRLPAKPPPRRGERGKKKSAKGRPSRHCPRSAAPYSPFSLARRPIDVPIAGEPSEDTSNKSAKVVLGKRSRSYSC